MNGHDQEVQSMWGKDISKWTPCMITSDSPATWRVYQSEDVTLNGLVIAGAAGFSKAGAAKLTVAAPASTTTGALEVVEGELSLGSAASFASVGEVKLLGGTLSMPSANLNTAATLWVSGGKISLPAGVSQKVAELREYDSVSGKWIKHLGRVYTTADCAWVEGGGEVVVTGGGTTLIFR
jgi:autotransporter-associated beta strand protein